MGGYFFSSLPPPHIFKLNSPYSEPQPTHMLIHAHIHTFSVYASQEYHGQGGPQGQPLGLHGGGASTVSHMIPGHTVTYMHYTHALQSHSYTHASLCYHSRVWSRFYENLPKFFHRRNRVTNLCIIDPRVLWYLYLLFVVFLYIYSQCQWYSTWRRSASLFFAMNFTSHCIQFYMKCYIYFQRY